MSFFKSEYNYNPVTKMFESNMYALVEKLYFGILGILLSVLKMIFLAQCKRRVSESVNCVSYVVDFHGNSVWSRKSALYFRKLN